LKVIEIREFIPSNWKRGSGPRALGERLLVDFVDAHARHTPDKLALVDNRAH
jgi:hypothetical protein